MAWFDDFNLPGATIDGYFGFIQADGPDDNDYPDVVLANGWVTFTATTEAARIDGAWLGIEPVKAQIFEGQIVISEEDPRPVRLLATDADIGVEDWAWRATFDVPGFKLDPLTFRAPRNTTVNLTSGMIPVDSAPFQIVAGRGIESITGVEDVLTVKYTDGGTDEVPVTLPDVPLGAVPIFVTAAAAQAWEAAHPGQVALTLEGGEPVAPTVVTAQQPTFSDSSRTITIPSVVGVAYFINGNPATAGSHPAPALSVTVTASALNSRYELVGTSTWEHVYPMDWAPYRALILGDNPEFYAPLTGTLDSLGSVATPLTMGSATWQNHPGIGTAATFNGTGTGITGARGTVQGGTSDPWTMEAVVRVADPSPRQDVFNLGGEWGAGYAHQNMRVSGGSAYAIWTRYDGNPRNVSAPGVAAGALTHLAIVRDATNITAYVNGVPGTPVAASPMENGEQVLIIGGAMNPLTGLILHVAAYPKALTVEDIQARVAIVQGAE